jgi:hypothetical protein
MTDTDVADVLESTRDRITQLAGEAASAAGVVSVLSGLIAMLRQNAPQKAAPMATPSAEVEEPVAEEAGEPARRPLTARERRRLQQAQEEKPANPLLSPQYAGFFNKLIADQKVPDKPREEAEEPEQPQEQQQKQSSSIKPQYRGFFDSLVQQQKAPDPPRPEPSDEGFRDETAT